MKVLGKVSKEVIIIEASKDEIQNIMGEQAWSHNDSPPVGTEFKVGSMYARARDTIDTYKELKSKFESIRNQMSTLLKRVAEYEETEDTAK